MATRTSRPDLGRIGAEEARMQSHTMNVNGVPVRWLEDGTGFPVVYVHGIPTSPALWRDVVPLVGARSLCFEMVGYGESIPAGVGRDISVTEQAEYLVAWLDAIGVETAVLVGHDLGGGVVQIAAVRQPKRCAGLVITNGVAYDSWPIPSVRVLQKLPALTSRLPDILVRAFLVTLFRRGHADAYTTGEAVRTHWKPYQRHGAAEALTRQVQSLHTADTLAVAPELPKLRVPSRVLWGAADGFQKVRYGERLARDLGTELRRIEAGRHWTPEDFPEAVAAAVNEVVAEATARA
jgi:pimeloyl-ACP methyl ester carboxylesterase